MTSKKDLPLFNPKQEIMLKHKNSRKYTALKEIKKLLNKSNSRQQTHLNQTSSNILHSQAESNMNYIDQVKYLPLHGSNFSLQTSG